MISFLFHQKKKERQEQLDTRKSSPEYQTSLYQFQQRKHHLVKTERISWRTKTTQTINITWAQYLPQ
uniref:Putative ovule protein n=1 Tax=Solanum chacoense TaxID=4108 RepID=A0A0V0GZV6_SOLCH